VPKSHGGGGKLRLNIESRVKREIKEEPTNFREKNRVTLINLGIKNAIGQEGRSEREKYQRGV